MPFPKEPLVTTTRKRKLSMPSPIQSISSPSVKLFWLNLDEVKDRLTRAAHTLAKTHPEIGEVWLFGSLARGQAVPGSDADLLLVLEECDLPFLERGVQYQPEFCGVGIDLFAYTRTELEQMERVCLFRRRKV